MAVITADKQMCRCLPAARVHTLHLPWQHKIAQWGNVMSAMMGRNLVKQCSYTCHAVQEQVLMKRLLIAQISGMVPVAGAVLLHEHWCVWSTLSRPDTAALYSFASMAMMPAGQGPAHPSLSQRITVSLRWSPCQSAQLG